MGESFIDVIWYEVSQTVLGAWWYGIVEFNVPLDTTGCLNHHRKAPAAPCRVVAETSQESITHRHTTTT